MEAARPNPIPLGRAPDQRFALPLAEKESICALTELPASGGGLLIAVTTDADVWDVRERRLLLSIPPPPHLVRALEATGRPVPKMHSTNGRSEFFLVDSAGKMLGLTTNAGLVFIDTTTWTALWQKFKPAALPKRFSALASRPTASGCSIALARADSESAVQLNELKSRSKKSDPSTDHSPLKIGPAAGSGNVDFDKPVRRLRFDAHGRLYALCLTERSLTAKCVSSDLGSKPRKAIPRDAGFAGSPGVGFDVAPAGDMLFAYADASNQLVVGGASRKPAEAGQKHTHWATWAFRVPQLDNIAVSSDHVFACTVSSGFNVAVGREVLSWKQLQQP